jgi:hypothetical protein
MSSCVKYPILPLGGSFWGEDSPQNVPSEDGASPQIQLVQGRSYSSFGLPASSGDASSNPCLIPSYSPSTGRSSPPARI